MKNIVIAAIVAVALIVSAVIIKGGSGNSENVAAPAYSLYGYEGVLYRLNGVNGRLDVLVPSNEAALLFPVGQIQLPAADDKLTDDQKKSFSQNIKTLSQYIQVERARTLGLKTDAAAPAETK